MHAIVPPSLERPALRPIVWFLCLLIVFSAPVDALIVHMGQSPAMLSRMLMWCPGLAALVTCLVCRIDVTSLGWSMPETRFLRWGYFLPWLYAIPVYVLTWLLLQGSFDGSGFRAQEAAAYKITTHTGAFALLFSVPVTLIFGTLSTIMWALGEELGWRGFLTPRLTAFMGPTRAGLVVGLIWAVWHYPSLLGGDYNAQTSPVYEVACFTVMVVAMGVVLSWLRLRSNSLWPCVLVHASHNTLIQGVLDATTAKTGSATFVTTEFGAGLAVTLTLCAIVVTLRERPRHA